MELESLLSGCTYQNVTNTADLRLSIGIPFLLGFREPDNWFWIVLKSEKEQLIFSTWFSKRLYFFIMICFNEWCVHLNKTRTPPTILPFLAVVWLGTSKHALPLSPLLFMLGAPRILPLPAPPPEHRQYTTARSDY